MHSWCYHLTIQPYSSVVIAVVLPRTISFETRFHKKKTAARKSDYTLTNPPNNLQRNIVQQNQPLQQDNLCQEQKQPYSRQRDRVRRNLIEDVPPSLANDSGWIFCQQACL